MMCLSPEHETFPPPLMLPPPELKYDYYDTPWHQIKPTENVERLLPADLLLDSDAEDDKDHHGGEGEDHQPQEAYGHPRLAQDHGGVLVLPAGIAGCLRNNHLVHWSFYLNNWTLVRDLSVVISRKKFTSSGAHVYHRVRLLHPVSDWGLGLWWSWSGRAGPGTLFILVWVKTDPSPGPGHASLS